MFDDQGIERSQMIAPAVTQAIREPRISLVVLSKNYASSCLRLDELLEILKCKENIGQIVMPVFYGVDPSEVQNQTGKFRRAFDETCARKTEEERRRWTQALNDVAHILPGYFINWHNESEMIEKISRDISNKLNTTISRDFGEMVGLETHLEKLRPLLDIESDEIRMIGIWGPPGIGKTTIARALHSRFSSSFQQTLFVENLWGSYNSGLQEKLVTNQNDMRISHLGATHERLSDQKVLIILEDVDDLKQLEALATETQWFGPGSRIIVTTSDLGLVRAHGINHIYHVNFPSSEEALKILSRSAFSQSYPHNGFKELAERVVDLCGNLPLSLSEVGSSLRGRKEEEWDLVIRRLESNIDHRDIEQAMIVFDPPSSNKRILKGKHRCSTGMAFLVVINLLLEIASAVADQLSSIRKPYFTRVSLVMSILSVVLSILDLTCKIRDDKARFKWQCPIPWFYHTKRGYNNRIFGNFADTVLLFCVAGGLIVSTVNWSFIEKGREGPIKVSIWPLFFAIGMVASKFMEKPVLSKDYSL